jgi:hypothetical protein
METFRNDVPLDTSLHIFRVQLSYTCFTKMTPLAHVLALTDKTSRASHLSQVTGREDGIQMYMWWYVPENFE